MKRVVTVVSAGICAVLVGSGLHGVARASAPSPVTAAQAVTVPLAPWQSCGGLQCSTLTVPLDYAHPENGKTVKLAVTRLVADPLAGTYAGLMLTNPGGPGGSGTWMPGLREFVPGTAANRYDWVGFDPRGVGDSVPALRCWPEYFGTDRPNFIPSTSGLMSYWLARTDAYADRCGASTAKRLLPFMTTRDTVRDMERLRAAYQAAAAVGKRPALAKLNYFGYSYGTYLGQAYATMFPAKVGRFVLDSVVDPNRFWYRSNLDQSKAFDRNLNLFFGWLAQNNATFRLGTSQSAIRGRYNQLVRNLDAYPAADRQLGPNELADALLPATYGVDNWPGIGRAFAALARYGQGGPLLGYYAGGNLGPTVENGYAVYNAVQCTDARRPAWSQWASETRAVHRTDPYLAWNNTWYNAPCRTWPAPSRTRIDIDGAALAALGTKILLINETDDGATPYPGALVARKKFPSSSLIAGVGGSTHAASLRGVPCVDNAIAAYLDDGTVPTRHGDKADLQCPGYPRPPADGARGATPRSAAPLLNERVTPLGFRFR